MYITLFVTVGYFYKCKELLFTKNSLIKTYFMVIKNDYSFIFKTEN